MVAPELVGLDVLAQATAAEQKHQAVAVVVAVDAQLEDPVVEVAAPK